MNTYKVSDHLERLEEGDEIYFLNHRNGTVMDISLGMIRVLDFLQQARTYEELHEFVKKQEKLVNKEKSPQELEKIVRSIEELLVKHELPTIIEK